MLFGLTCLALPASATPCTPDTTACNAAGGNGPNPPRGGTGGEGNGHGGDGTSFNGSGVTVATPGAPSAGGTGGDGGYGDFSAANGGAPGITGTGSLVTLAPITGTGGDPGPDGNNFASGGGGGGAGVYEIGTDLTIGTVQIKGGDGGKGGDGLAGGGANGGGGGGGGAGIAVSSSASVTNNGTIIGGNGGAGGQGDYPGGGGGGGDGIVVTAVGATINQYGAVKGGQGGPGVVGAFGTSVAGDSGAGINLIGTFTNVTNIGTIAGGDSSGGAAGVGVMTNGSGNIFNYGVISGGLSSDGVSRAAAIRFGGANNVYQAGVGSSLIGTIELIGGAEAVVTSINTGPIANDVSLGSNATLSLRGTTGDLTMAGIISGSGGVKAVGTGKVVLTGVNTYTGGTTLTGGTLSVASDANLGNAAGALTFNGGTLQITGTSFSHTSRGINWNGGGFDIADANNSFTINQSLTGAGALIKLGAGSLILTSTNTYSGATTVNGGMLAVNGSIASSSLLSVNAGAIIGGDGVLPTTVLASGAALAPGNSIGALTVSGDLTFNAGSTYNVEVSPAAADRTNVSGAANLAGVVNATYAPGGYTSKRYTILTASSLNGRFAALSETGAPRNVDTALSYDAGNVYLDLALKFQAPSTGLSRNQQSVADTLTGYFNNTGGIPTSFTTLSPAGLSQVSGEAGAAPILPMIADVNMFTTAVFDGALGALGAAPRDMTADAALGYAPRRRHAAADAIAALPQAPLASRWGVWAGAYGGNSRVSGDAAIGSSTTTSHVYGGLAGVSYRASANTVLGFALGGAGTSFSLDGGFGSGKTDVFHAALYGLHDIGRAYVAGLVGYAWHDATTDRTVSAAGSDTLHARFHPQAISSRLEAGYRLAAPLVDVTPYGALQMASFYLPAYGETATAGSNQFALSYGSRTANAVRGELGLRLAKSLALASGTLALKGRAAWAHDDYNGRGATATFQTLPGTSFTVDGAEPKANVALLSAGAEYGFGQGWSLAASFDGEFSGNSTSYAGKGSLRRVW